MIDGCPPGLELAEADIQRDLDRRRPGQSRFTTQRREADQVKILSGVFADADEPARTTGTPIALMIENTDQRSKDYGEIKDKYRPGHADFTYDAKYGIRDYRGGGRSSARETAARVAAGAVARRVVSGVTDPRCPRADRPASGRQGAMGLGTRSHATPSSAPTPPRRRLGNITSTMSARAARPPVP